ncbi:MAG: aminotransferase class I/II-fold pyridoxal phosphate-dependent enzyme, partial [Actinomycetia bacterium]|nr:aminotransferase class I/II-fold pyridoxal phosphate-dependent enzyme [Actinomycetes bacterium]
NKITMQLTAMGLEVAPSEANFLLFGKFDDRHAIWEGLLAQGILIRETGPQGWLRVSVGTQAESEMFIECLRTLV